jgi:geranylgeranyldiphosphate transferase
MSLFVTLPELFHHGAGILLGMGVASSVLYFIVDRIPIPRWLNKKAQLIGQTNPEKITGLECPYEYLRGVYGKYHWAPFVHKLSPKLRNDDHSKYIMVLEIMDAIHLCLMLVDDVRKNFPGIFFGIIVQKIAD